MKSKVWPLWPFAGWHSSPQHKHFKPQLLNSDLMHQLKRKPHIPLGSGDAVHDVQYVITVRLRSGRPVWRRSPVGVLSLHTACPFACCALRTVRTLSELRLSECPSLCPCLHALTVSNRDECLVTLKSYESAFFEMLFVLH